VAISVQKTPIHPALLEIGEERARSLQNRVADAITRFAGSMWFAYVHIVWFTVWIVMISQNRQDDARRHLADQEWGMVQSEEHQNEELLGLSNQILDLTKAIHQLTVAHTGAVGGAPAEPK
jgi:uncharacterized membrane protein